jgi:hypothetical protein
MSFRVQTYYPGAGMFLNTNHTSDDLDELKRLVAGDTFLGFRIRIVDDEGNVVFAPPVRERTADLTISGIAEMLGAPIIDLPEEAFDGCSAEPTEMTNVGYTLVALHEGALEPIASFSLSEHEAMQIIERLWPGANLWAAPGGCSFCLADQREADTVNDVLRDRCIAFNNDKHRWLLHVHLV